MRSIPRAYNKATERTCPTCGKVFLRKPSHKTSYCSRPCMRVSKPERFWSKVDKSGGPNACWPWQGCVNQKGYGETTWNGICTAAHRVADILTNGPIPPGIFVRHKVCDNPPCCNPAHLLRGTNQENMADKVEHSRVPSMRKEKNPGAKLTQADVDEIRQKYATGLYTQSQLAKEKNIARGYVSVIVHHRSW